MHFPETWAPRGTPEKKTITYFCRFWTPKWHFPGVSVLAFMVTSNLVGRGGGPEVAILAVTGGHI